MPDGPLKRGAKPLTDRDWMFGSRPRRRLLEGVLLGRAPEPGWTRPQLADMAGVVANGGVDEHLDGLRRLGLIKVDHAESGMWCAVRPHGDLAKAVRKVLQALAGTPDVLPIREASNMTRTAAAIRTVAAAERAVSATASELGESTVEELLELLGQARQRLSNSRTVEGVNGGADG